MISMVASMDSKDQSFILFSCPTVGVQNKTGGKKMSGFGMWTI